MMIQSDTISTITRMVSVKPDSCVAVTLLLICVFRQSAPGPPDSQPTAGDDHHCCH